MFHPLILLPLLVISLFVPATAVAATSPFLISLSSLSLSLSSSHLPSPHPFSYSFPISISSLPSLPPSPLSSHSSSSATPQIFHRFLACLGLGPKVVQSQPADWTDFVLSTNDTQNPGLSHPSLFYHLRIFGCDPRQGQSSPVQSTAGRRLSIASRHSKRQSIHSYITHPVLRTPYFVHTDTYRVVVPPRRTAYLRIS